MTGLAPPKITPIFGGINFYTPQSGSVRLVLDLQAGGGGGCGSTGVPYSPTDPTARYPFECYGGRGGDVMVHLRPAATVTIVPGTTTVIQWPGHGCIPGQAVFFAVTPSDPALQNGVYYVKFENFTSSSFEISTNPYSPPFLFSLFQSQGLPINGVPYSGRFQWPVATIPGCSYPAQMMTPWYGVQGGGGGGVIGDQGCPQSPWGLHTVGPDGKVQSWHDYAGTGCAAWNMGGPGPAGFHGGASGAQFGPIDGIDGADGTGAGGGGAPPGPDPMAPTGPGGTSGAAGVHGTVIMRPRTFWYWVGGRGAPGLGKAGGFNGGAGSLPRLLILDYTE